MAKASYLDLFTEDVVRRWYEWLQEGRSLHWIGRNNGVRRTTGNTVKTYLKKFGYPSTVAEAQAALAAEDEPEGHGQAPAATGSENGADEVTLSRPEPGHIDVNGKLPAVINQLQALQKVLGASGAKVRVQASIDLHISMQLGN